jgi:hypothetical protein
LRNRWLVAGWLVASRSARPEQDWPIEIDAIEVGVDPSWGKMATDVNGFEIER